MVDVSHITVAITIELVIVGISAIIVTEFFICSAMQMTVAAKANFVYGDHGYGFVGIQTGTTNVNELLEIE